MTDKMDLRLLATGVPGLLTNEMEMRTVISVVKVRGAKHSRQIRTFDITDEGVVIGDGPAPYDGILAGNARTGSF